jgi:hypothetical protein
MMCREFVLKLVDGGANCRRCLEGNGTAVFEKGLREMNYNDLLAVLR